jgi:hypothetical protein
MAVASQVVCRFAARRRSALADRKEPVVEDKSNVQEVPEVAVEPKKVRKSIPQRAGAAGKAAIAYLATGSIGVAVVVFIVAKLAGC